MGGRPLEPASVGEALFAAPRVELSRKSDGTIYLRSAHELTEPSRCIGDWLVEWAAKTPDAVCVAEKKPDGSWRRLTYAEVLKDVRAIAGWLLKSEASPQRPVAVLSENAVDHALLALAAMHAGIPVATVSTAYSLMSKDHAKLKAMIELLDPGLIYVSDTNTYGGALAAIEGLHAASIVASSVAPGDVFGAVRFADARDTANEAAVDEAFAAVGPDTIAKLLFTSGSTGTPKAVINTHRMLTTNQEANRVVWPFLTRKPPVVVDWLPWSHTFGANFTTNLVLRNGGALYIDDGKPAPPLIGRTAANIKEIRPTISFNVPRGYDMLIHELENDPEFSDAFFNMDLVFYAAAALPKTIWDKLIELSLKAKGRVVPLVAAWGSTETAPLSTSCHFQAETTGNIGVPVPGTELKLVPNGDKLEVRVKGPNVTPGYFRFEEMTKKAFDEEGFYIMGDAVRFADPNDPDKGLFFDGRVSEDFKLSSGTWVSVGDIRIAGIDALSPVAQDIVVTGHDHDEIGFLVFPNEMACRRLAQADADAPLGDVLASDAVHAYVKNGLAALKAAGGGSSRHATRARLMAVPPNPDTGEITDKAYLNQRQILANRVGDVEALQGDDPAAYIAL